MVSAGSIKLVRLTLVNKSEFDMAVRLSGKEDENLFYYLRIPAGETGIFTIVPAVYQMTPYYLELWDPVYGDSCSDPGSKTLYAQRNIRITFHSCDETIPR